MKNSKSGFTLAEVLVTLMIIGVIAAMTIPSLMQSTAQQEYRAAFKKAVSMLNQAVTLNYALDGQDASSFTGTSFFNLLTQRMNVMSSDDSAHTVYTADGMWFQAQASNGDLSANPCNNNNLTTESTNICSLVTVDVNGAKGPNKDTTATNAVYDIFTIAIYPQKALPATQAQGEVLYSK